MSWKKTPWIIILFLAMIISPYIMADLAGGNGLTFSGFLVNPIDGYSYLAKMRQGFDGAWLFKLPFTSDPGKGEPLFLFYLLLGHLANWLGCPLITMYHGARIVSAVFLIGSLIWYLQKNRIQGFSIEYLLLVLLIGSGMGWLFVGTGKPTSDLWVAEMYPFLSAYTNPHFPLSISLMLIVLGIHTWKTSWAKLFLLMFAGLCLAVLQPFCLVIVDLVLIIGYILNKKLFEQSSILTIVMLNCLALPWLIYTLIMVAGHPILSIWNKQNVTPAPALWDLVVSLSPGLIFAVIGAWKVVIGKEKNFYPILSWAILGLGISFIPFGLQRRFLIGLYIPITLLALIGLQHFGLWIKKFGIMKVFYIALVIPTNVIVVSLAIFASQSKPQNLYLRQAEMEAFQWIENNTQTTDVFLTGTETGALIPAYTGRRVVYGHPFETPNADAKKQNVITCLNNFSTSECQIFLENEQVNYIMIGPREDVIDLIRSEIPGDLVYQNEQVSVYAQDN